MPNNFRKIENQEEWRALLGKVLFKTFFHSWEWEEFLEKNFKWLKFERYNWRNQGLLSLARVKVFGKEKLISHPFCEYGGPLPLVDKINAGDFKQDLFSEFKDPIRISFHPRLLDYFQDEQKNVFSSSGRVSFATYSLYLRKTTRHEIEKAKTSNLKIEKCQNIEDLKNFYNLYIRSVRKHRIPAYPFPFFEYFAASPAAEIILVKKNGRVIAGSVFLLYDKCIQYFLNASSSKGAQERANYLILWDQMDKYCGKGLSFDLGGTRKNSSLSIFKQGFGTAPVEIYEIKNLTENKENKFSLARKIWTIMPLFLIKKYSPYLLKYKL